jgi:hypothetical protein
VEELPEAMLPQHEALVPSHEPAPHHGLAEAEAEPDIAIPELEAAMGGAPAEA